MGQMETQESEERRVHQETKDLKDMMVSRVILDLGESQVKQVPLENLVLQGEVLAS